MPQKVLVCNQTSHNGRKIPIILPLIVNGRVVTKFKGKANIFNKYFTAVGYQENQTYITEPKLSSCDIENEDIYKIQNS